MDKQDKIFLGVITIMIIFSVIILVGDFTGTAGMIADDDIIVSLPIYVNAFGGTGETPLASQCTEPGYDQCWEHSYQDAYVKLYLTLWEYPGGNFLSVVNSGVGVPECSNFCYAEIIGGETYFYPPGWIATKVGYVGDKAYHWANANSWPEIWASCDCTGCSAELITAGNHIHATVGQTWYDSPSYASRDTGPSGACTGIGIGQAGCVYPCQRIHVVECYYNSDCGSGQLCDKSGSWEQWNCLTPVCSSNADCSDGNPCTSDVCNNPGEAGSYCENTPITACTHSDGCCPVGCNSNNDNDCTPVCGNNIVETGEDCDGNTESQQCGVSDVGVCEYGTETRTCSGACQWNAWGSCIGAVYPSDEILNGLDDDCDGEIDEDICGNGICEAGEDHLNCPADCVEPCNCNEWIVGECSNTSTTEIGYREYTRICDPVGCDIDFKTEIDESCKKSDVGFPIIISIVIIIILIGGIYLYYLKKVKK